MADDLSNTLAPPHDEGAPEPDLARDHVELHRARIQLETARAELERAELLRKKAEIEREAPLTPSPETPRSTLPGPVIYDSRAELASWAGWATIGCFVLMAAFMFTREPGLPVLFLALGCISLVVRAVAATREGPLSDPILGMCALAGVVALAAAWIKLMLFFYGA